MVDIFYTGSPVSSFRAFSWASFIRDELYVVVWSMCAPYFECLETHWATDMGESEFNEFTLGNAPTAKLYALLPRVAFLRPDPIGSAMSD